MSLSQPGQSDVLGYVEHDEEANAYVYWCIDCAPGALRQPHREVDMDEAEAQEAVCDACGWRLADGATL